MNTTSSAVRSEPSCHFVPSCSGTVSGLVGQALDRLGQARLERAVQEVEPQQALVDELALATGGRPVGRRRPAG